MLFVFFFQFGIGPLLWTYLPECLPAKALSPGATLNWAAFISISLITKPMTLSSLGVNGTFAIFGGCCLIITIYCAIVLVESKGRSRRDIILEYAGYKDIAKKSSFFTTEEENQS